MPEESEEAPAPTPTYYKAEFRNLPYTKGEMVNLTVEWDGSERDLTLWLEGHDRQEDGSWKMSWEANCTLP